MPEKITIPTLDTLAKYRGIQSLVARRLGVTRGHVSKVVHGQKKSARVEREIRREMARLARKAA